MLCGCGMALGWPKKKAREMNTHENDEPSRIAEGLPRYSTTKNEAADYVFDPTEIIDQFRNRRSRAPSAETLRKESSSRSNVKKEVQE